jgi:hypothetical protein
MNRRNVKGGEFLVTFSKRFFPKTDCFIEIDLVAEPKLGINMIISNFACDFYTKYFLKIPGVF